MISINSPREAHNNLPAKLNLARLIKQKQRPRLASLGMNGGRSWAPFMILKPAKNNDAKQLI